MKAPADQQSSHTDNSHAEMLRTLRHDIKNQLSNIHMAVEQLRYEIPDPSEDCKFYMDSIIMSSETINKVLTEVG
jgi:nitrogen-specific signal transduction histidine kinase